MRVSNISNCYTFLTRNLNIAFRTQNTRHCTLHTTNFKMYSENSTLEIVKPMYIIHCKINKTNGYLSYWARQVLEFQHMHSCGASLEFFLKLQQVQPPTKHIFHDLVQNIESEHTNCILTFFIEKKSLNTCSSFILARVKKNLKVSDI